MFSETLDNFPVFRLASRTVSDTRADTRAEANKATIRKFYELMDARKFDEMWTLFANDAVWGGGGTPPKQQGPIDAMKAIMVDPMPIFADGGIHFTLHTMVAEGDWVSAEAESYAELVNGKVYNNHYHMLFEFRDGLIVQVKEYGDSLHAHEVFGELDLG